MTNREKPISENDKTVLTIIKKSRKPLTAYDILEKLRGSKIKAPQTIYRSLEALVGRGLVHRIQSLGAFVACHNDEEDHGSQFAVCRECKTVIELHDHRICNFIREMGNTIQFTIEREMVELIGLCAECEKKTSAVGQA